jgi:hypothetical protein
MAARATTDSIDWEHQDEYRFVARSGELYAAIESDEESGCYRVQLRHKTKGWRAFLVYPGSLDDLEHVKRQTADYLRCLASLARTMETFAAVALLSPAIPLV